MTLSTQAPKGTADWLPEEFAVRKYIFDTWRQVCLSYGYEEYLTPLVEAAEVYRAKSGADVGGKELVTFTDLGGRELSIRPEMTPSVTRMVSQIYDSSPKPLRLFSIANFMRNEKPQRGRNREFWQLNVDMFGAESTLADVELLSLALDIMLAFKAPAGSFTLGLNHRQLIEGVLSEAEVLPEQRLEVVRLMDKWLKMELTGFKAALSDLKVADSGVEVLVNFLSSDSLDDLLKRLPNLQDNFGLASLRQLDKMLTDLGYGQWLIFKPSVIRGFDYYDGLVFEIFDNHPENRRALFGGGRYNGLASIFGAKSFPAAGFAPGDETLKLFLQSWNLLPSVLLERRQQSYFLPVLSEQLVLETLALAKQLRAEGKIVELSTDVWRVGKALEYANKKQCGFVVIMSDYEHSLGIYKIKHMLEGRESEHKIA